LLILFVSDAGNGSRIPRPPLLFGLYLWYMKIIITENQSFGFISKLIDNYNIKPDIIYLYDNGLNSITATVYLYKDGEVLGYNRGYEFVYRYDSRFGSLDFMTHYPKLESIDIFRFLPPELVVQYFSEKVKTYLKKFIDSGYSTLPRKK